MAKYTYLHKTIRGLFEIEEQLGEEKTKGTTYEDYLNGLWIPVKKTMSAFIKANPTASVKEWIEMELEPAPPEPSLKERKATAIEEATQRAVDALENLFPLSVIKDVVFGLMDEEAFASLRHDYVTTKQMIIDSYVVTSEAIERAESADEARNAVAGFNESVRLTVDSGIVRDVVRDSLIVVDRITERDVVSNGRDNGQLIIDN